MNTTRALPASSAFAALASLLFLMACAPKYYSPNAQNVPLLRSAGEGSVGASINPEANRADARGAFAVGRSIGLMANASMYFPRDDDSGNGGRGGLFEVGAGYFRPMAHNFVFETYGLLAYGGLENHFETVNPNGTLNANLVRVAVQPAIGYRHRWVEAAFSSRIAMLNYFNVDGDLVRGGESEEEYLRENRQQFLLEPAVTVRAGIGVLKAEAQLGRSLNLGDDTFPQDDLWGSLGLVYYFEPR
jgi:hypothetical protein